MILITGGAFQGKTAYAKSHFPGEITDGASCGTISAETAEILINYHLLLRRIAEPESFTASFCKENPDCVVVIQEVGCGIVPLEKEERIWSETVGRCGCILAEHADVVIRMVCGIPTVIKGALL